MSEQTPAPRRLTHSEIIDRQIAALARTTAKHGSCVISRNARGIVQFEVQASTGEEGIATLADAVDEACRQADRLAAKYPYPQEDGGDA